MELTLEQLRAAAGLLSSDVARTADRSWHLYVDDAAVLHSHLGADHDTVAIDRELAEEDYVLADALIAGDEAGLQEVVREYASEVVWGALGTVLWARGAAWPRCADHPSRRIDVCLGVWYCEGPESHDVGMFGELPSAAVTWAPNGD